MDSIISDLQQELIELTEKLKAVDESINKIMDGIFDEEIGVGSRVLLTHLSKPIEGRVCRVKGNDIFSINRDGYAGELLVKGDKLKHLSVGTYGKLEKQQWILHRRIKNTNARITEQINKRIVGIKQILIKGIDIQTAKRIINTQNFQTWYKNNRCEAAIPLSKLSNSSPIFICGLAREFSIASPNEILYQTLIATQL